MSVDHTFNFFVERKNNFCLVLCLLSFSPLKFVNLKFHSIRKHLCHSFNGWFANFLPSKCQKAYILMLLMFLLCFHFDLFLFSHFVGVSSTSFLEFMSYYIHLSFCHLLQSFSRHIIFHRNINFPAQTSNPSVEEVKPVLNQFHDNGIRRRRNIWGLVGMCGINVWESSPMATNLQLTSKNFYFKIFDHYTRV